MIEGAAWDEWASVMLMQTSLTRRERQAVYLVCVRELERSDAAQVLDITPGSVSALLSHARHKLLEAPKCHRTTLSTR
jgi:DNA-directed RNA polymerase specialized sigma24 family protein